jgi:hypothetical protein
MNIFQPGDFVYWFLYPHNIEYGYIIDFPIKGRVKAFMFTNEDEGECSLGCQSNIYKISDKLIKLIDPRVRKYKKKKRW